MPSAQAHPFRKFFDEKVRVTLNTDDPAISNITLSDEFELAAREYHLKPGEVRELLMNAAGEVFGEKSLQRDRMERLATETQRCGEKQI